MKNSYPCWRYHPTERAVICKTPEEEANLGHGWRDVPYPEQPVPVVLSAEEELKNLQGKFDAEKSNHDMTKLELKSLLSAMEVLKKTMSEQEAHGEPAPAERVSVEPAPKPPTGSSRLAQLKAENQALKSR